MIIKMLIFNVLDGYCDGLDVIQKMRCYPEDYFFDLILLMTRETPNIKLFGEFIICQMITN